MSKACEKIIYIKLSSGSQISIVFPEESQQNCTCHWLLREAKAKLTQSFPNETNFENIVTLQTENSAFAVDYWLTQPHRNARFLKNGTVLMPFYAQTTTPSDNLAKNCLDNYLIEAKLNDGAFANVYLGNPTVFPRLKVFNSSKERHWCLICIETNRKGKIKLQEKECASQRA